MSRLDAAYRVTERLWWGMSARAIVILIAVLTAVRLYAALHVGLLRDEPYYWLWSQHLAAGYYDHPPMVALWIRAGTALFGDTVLGLRSAFILNTVLITLAAYALGRVLFDKRIAERGALWTNLVPLLGIAGIMATPDGPSVLFWTLTVLAFALVLKTERGVWWLAVGLMAGLGAVSKYTNLFLGPGIILALAIDPRLRRWFLSSWTWAGGLVALVVFLPVIQWNAAHDWASFRFQFGRTAETTFHPVDFLTLIVTQPLIFNPLAFVFLVIAGRIWLRRSASPQAREIGLLLATSLPAAAFILFQATHGTVLQHWLAPIFPALTVAAVAAASALPERARILRRIRADVVPFALVAMAIVVVYATTPADRWFPGKDPLNSLRGWPQYAEEIEALREKSGAAWIATSGYERTSQLAWELRGRATVIPIDERQRYTFAPTPDAALVARPALLVSHDPPDLWARCFAKLTPVGVAIRQGAVATFDRTYATLAEGPVAGLFPGGCDASGGD
jgi:4-amino-4-deoxy-L-arabinose transferase-like glycosyltransferase